MKHVSKLLAIIVFCLFLPAHSRSQSMDEMMRRLSQIQRQTMSEVGQQQQKVYQRYYDLIGKPWTETTGENPLESPLDHDTPICPIPSDESCTASSPNELFKATVFHSRPLTNDGMKPKDPVIMDDGQQDDMLITILSNGYEVEIRFPQNGKVHLSGTTEGDVADAWEKMESIRYTNLLKDLSGLRKYLKMSDWSIVQAIEQLTKKVYGPESHSGAVLTEAFLLNKLGYLIGLARSDDGKLHKLLATDMGILRYPSYRIDGHNYYLFEEDSPKRLSIVNLGSNGETPLRMQMSNEEGFHPSYARSRRYASRNHPSISVEVRSDLSRMKHYETYPLYFDGEDVLSAFYYHAQTPLSDDIKSAVYPVLHKALQEKSETEAVNMLLNFVQTAFTYEYDKVVWGKERYFYADEIWCYDRSDCEDRAILFSNLVRDLIGLKVALVYWPGHLSCAVCFNSVVEGAHFTIDGKRYVSCDPTFIGSGAGAIMDAVKNLPATLLPL